MERINKLYTEVNDIEHLRNLRNEKLASIQSLEKELYSLIEYRTHMESKRPSVTALQRQLTEIESDIRHLSIKTKTITQLSELLDITDSAMFREKTFEFVNELVYDWLENDDQTIVLNKDTVSFFRRVKSEEYYKDLKAKYYERLSQYFKGFCYAELGIEETSGEFYFSVAGDLSDKGRYKTFYDKNKELCNFLFQVLFNNLDSKLYGMFEKRQPGFLKVLSKNNELLLNTKYFVRDECSHIEKIILGVIEDICMSPRADIVIDLDSRESNFSEEFATLLFCFASLNDKSKIASFKPFVTSLFSLEKIERNLFNYICVFSEIDHLIKKFNFTHLIIQKEYLFCEIIKISGALDINLKSDFETIRNDIYQNQYAFKEIIDLFLNDNFRFTFLISYFDALCDSVLKYLIQRESISIKESEGFADLISFLLELCGIESLLNNHDRMKCVEVVLRSSLREIEDLYVEGKICLEGEEFSRLICSLFTETEKRDGLLRRVSGK